DQQLVLTNMLELQRHYATTTAVKSNGEPLAFTVAIADVSKIVSARLVIGVHRGGGIAEPLMVEVNGTPVEIDTGDAAEFSEFFAPLDAKVAPTVIRDENEVKITTQSGTTITSVQLVTNSLEDIPK
ncbi:MAG: hypothetical protein H6821_11310, partial [Planctomycetaceae bacterium]|nr:hypothetical protein [Planctomycetaceae bacterium]